jgi:hypothetical protein
MVSERIKVSPILIAKLSHNTPFPADHDEVAASWRESGTGPGCSCAVCVRAVGPRQVEQAEVRAAAARAEVAAIAKRLAAQAAYDLGRAARLEAACVEVEGLEACVEGSSGREDEETFVDAAEPDESEA